MLSPWLPYQPGCQRSVLCPCLRGHQSAEKALHIWQVTDAVGIEELPAEPEKVLLTGANGFLGRFLLLDFLKRVSTK